MVKLKTVLSILVVLAALLQPVSAYTWNIDTIDTYGNVGLYTSISLSPIGNPGISYYDATNGNLKYAYPKTGGNCGPAYSWKCETIDYVGNVGMYTSIKTISSFLFLPQISYYNATTGNLKHASYFPRFPYSGWEWDTRTVDSPGDVGKYTSIAPDSYNRPYISYYNATSGDLKFYNGSSGKIEIIDSAGNVGSYTSIAVGSNNTPHISYYNATGRDLKYAVRVGTGGNCGPGNSWKCEVVDSAGYVGMYTSIVLDSNNRPHISYYNVTSGDLKYAWRIGTGGNCGPGNSWRCQTVDSAGNVGSYSSIALDSNNRPHFSYYNATGRDLKYARLAQRKYPIPGWYWYKETVDSPGNVGMYSSIALDSNNTPHISYYNATGGDLKHAKRS